MSDGVEIVQGKRVLIRYEGKKCIHSRFCVLVPNVAGEWIHPDRATPEEVAELAHLCPSGAIRYQRLDGHADEAPPEVNVLRLRENGPLANRAGPLTITPLPNGPYQVEGNLELCAGTGRTIQRLQKTRLCRCGHSGNKPYCDGTHVRIGFTAE